MLRSIAADRVCFDRIGGVKLLIVLHSEGVWEGDSREGSAAEYNVEDSSSSSEMIL